MTWIPTSERLPDDAINVLVCVPEASEPVWMGYLDSGEWFWDTGVSIVSEVTHWQPLPEVAE